MKKIHLADAVFVLTTMIVCSSLLTTMAAVTLFPQMMATPFPVINNNRDCPLFCSGTDREMHSPICGTNGTANRSYENECFMRVLNCRYNTNFTKIHEGLCKSPSSAEGESMQGVSPTPDNSSQATTAGVEVPTSQTSWFGSSSNDSSAATNSYEVYENVQEKQSNNQEQSNSFSSIGTTVTPDSTTTTTIEAFKSLENSGTLNSTSSSIATTQEFSSFDQSSSSTDAAVKDLNNSTSENTEVTTKVSENGSGITSETNLFKIPSISYPTDQLKNGDDSQSTTVNPMPNSSTGIN
ncbi:cell wall integrity and stress response component 1-like [Nilaparvata lugens]|uniref:cell wall integrity and stress response component 1-like n=1 Tax=Nilaparvata lugens TaxID=108931 RepID=UPI00193E6EE6|nr:cell wall integrity and stress response component 1-like [Nilaparvata lugens]